ncbi:MAG TPA: hypothetical protein PKM21_15950 [Anaerolineales bacterium]|nr:hypothetical protein [Anaerolineales bacterium]
MTEEIEIDDLETGETEVVALEPEPAPVAEEAEPAPAAPDAQNAPDGDTPKATSIGKIDPDKAMKGTVSITVTFLPEPDEPGERRKVVAAIRHEMGLPLAIIGPFPDAELDLPTLFDDLRQAAKGTLLHESAKPGKRPARTITFQKPNATTSKPALQNGKEEVSGQLGLF